MKEKIEELISQHDFAQKEIKNMLEELSQIDDTKLSPVDLNQLDCSKIALESELEIRLQVINSLEDLIK
jgi:hypothetical protein|nr:MAG TPA: hypothetical protein [Caudoviricetes sp.]